MKTYYDLDERERAKLSEDEMAEFIRREMMNEGVLAPKAMVLQSEDAPEIKPCGVAYAIKVGWRTSDLVYETREAAEAALEGCRNLDNHYIGGQSFKSYESDPERSIVTIPIHDAGELAIHRSALEKAERARESNRKERERFETDSKAVAGIECELWGDHRIQAARLVDAERLVETFDSYVKTADGDEAVAAKFLLKAYPRERVIEAFEWVERDLPTLPEPEAAPEPGPEVVEA